MRISISKFSALLSVAVLLCSCKLENTINITNNRVMGNAYDGAFISDEGLRYDISNKDLFPEVLTNPRTCVLCNISGVENAVAQVAITSSDSVQIVEAVHVKKADSLNYIPVNLSQCWFSGGYINMAIGTRDEEKDNPINVEFGIIDSLSYNGILNYEIRFTDSHTDSVAFKDKYFNSYKYYSIPIYDTLKVNPNPQILINWTSFRDNVAGKKALQQYWTGSWCYLYNMYVQPALYEDKTNDEK
ncbi:MAG: hypothetical protein MJY62_02940 [Bacteroidales bacterium]|nr:hypothetical protein [Bacteroidales bacterium]